MTSEEAKIAAVHAAKNEWGKTFKLGGHEVNGQVLPEREFEIKDLSYFDYVEFVQLAKPLIRSAAGGLNLQVENGEMGVAFDPSGLDFDTMLSVCGKELPRMAWLICRQTDPKLKEIDVALLGHRPQRLVEVVLLQIKHNKMIEEFADFFQRLTSMVVTLMPDVTKAAAPIDATESMTEETPSS